MTRFKVRVIGYRETRPLIVEAENLQQASKKAKEELGGFPFERFHIEEDPKSIQISK